MTATERAARTALLVQARRAATQHKQQQAMEAIRSLEDAGARVTVTDVARAAHVSTWFIYNNVTVRAAVNDAARRQTATPESQRSHGLPSDHRTLQGLRVDLSGARDEIRALREERTLLRRRLEQSLGQQLDKIVITDLADSVEDLTTQRNTLVDELAAARAQLARSAVDTAALQDELDGARTALRRMMREASGTRPPGPSLELA